MSTGLLHRVLNLVDPLGHRAEVLLLLPVSVGAQDVQVLVGVGGIGGLVVVLGVVRAVVAVGVPGQEGHQLTGVRLFGDLAVPHQSGEVHDVLVGHHVIRPDIFTLVLGDVEEHMGVVGVVDHQLGGQPLRPVLQVVGPLLDLVERQRPDRTVAGIVALAGRLAPHVRRLHRQVGGVGVGAEPTDEGELPPVSPLAPLAGAVPVGNLVAAGEPIGRGLVDQHIVGAVVTVHRGHDPVRGDVLDMDRAGGLQPHRLLADVLPGRRPDRRVALHQVHVFGEARVQTLIQDVADPVNVGLRVVPELGHRVIVVVGPGGDVDVLVAQTGRPVGGLDQATPVAGVGGVHRAVAALLATVHQAVEGHRAEGPQERDGQSRRGGFVPGRPPNESAPAAAACRGHLVHAAFQSKGGTHRVARRCRALPRAVHRVRGLIAPVGVASVLLDQVPGLLTGLFMQLFQVGDRQTHPTTEVPDALEHARRRDSRLASEQVRVRPRLVIVLGVVEADRVRGPQPLISVDVVDRLNGRGTLIARGADRLMLRIRVIGQIGRVVVIHRCPGQTAVHLVKPPLMAAAPMAFRDDRVGAFPISVLAMLGLPGLIVVGGTSIDHPAGITGQVVVTVAVVVVMGPHPVPVEVPARVLVLGQLVVGRSGSEGVGSQPIPEVVAVPMRGVEVHPGRLVGTQLGLIQPDLEALTGHLEGTAAPHDVLVNDPARTVLGVNRRHCLSSLKGFYTFEGVRGGLTGRFSP